MEIIKLLVPGLLAISKTYGIVRDVGLVYRLKLCTMFICQEYHRGSVVN